MMEKKSFTMNSSWTWFLAGLKVFKAQPLIMMLGALVWMLIEFIIALIPVAGEMIDGLLFPVLYAGFVFSAHKIESGEKPVIADFFVGLTDKNKRISLLFLGGIIVLFEVLTIAFVMTLGGLAVTILFPLGILVFSALIFSVPIILFDEARPNFIKVFLNSSQTCGKHLTAVFAIYLILFLLLSISVLTYGVALPVVVPLIFCMMYKGYRAIYA